MSRLKYEIIEIDHVVVNVDVSLLRKTEDMFFNATEMAKFFGKQPNDFLRLDSTKEYVDEIISEFQTGDSRFEDLKYENLVRTVRGGKYKGTWLSKELAFEFAGWLSPKFRRKLHKWVEERIIQEHFCQREWEQKRLEAKTGFLPMTEAIQGSHDDPKFYHFSNEADMLNRIVTGMSAKEFKETHGVENVRDALEECNLAILKKLQVINTGLIEAGMDYDERKEKLMSCYNKYVK